MVAQQETSLGVMMKGKRTKRPRPSSPAFGLTTDEADSSSVEWAGPKAKSTEEEEDMAQCLILLAQGFKSDNNNNNNNNNKASASSYECKTCNKSFPSFQALGGHRASHKKPKFVADPDHQPKKSPVFFSLLDGSNQYDQKFNEEEIGLSLQIANTTNINNSNNNNKMKVHECSICGAEFSSGQALGGHMRRHRPIGGVPSSPSQSNVPILNATPKHHTSKDQEKTKNFLSLDLNLPAPEDDNNQHQQRRDSSYIFSSKEKTLVFSPSSLVDCHY